MVICKYKIAYREYSQCDNNSHYSQYIQCSYSQYNQYRSCVMVQSTLENRNFFLFGYLKSSAYS